MDKHTESSQTKSRGEAKLDSKNSNSHIESMQKTAPAQDKKEGKTKTIIKGANDLSLGISMVVAVLIGLGLGYLLYKLTGYYWLIFVGLFYGFGAAFLNVFKAYKRLHKDLESLKDNEKYKYMKDKNKD